MRLDGPGREPGGRRPHPRAETCAGGKARQATVGVASGGRCGEQGEGGAARVGTVTADLDAARQGRGADSNVQKATAVSWTGKCMRKFVGAGRRALASGSHEPGEPRCGPSCEDANPSGDY